MGISHSVWKNVVRAPDAGGGSRDVQVGDSEQVLWVWRGTWVHGLRRNGFCWEYGSLEEG